MSLCVCLSVSVCLCVSVCVSVCVSLCVCMHTCVQIEKVLHTYVGYIPVTWCLFIILYRVRIFLFAALSLSALFFSALFFCALSLSALFLFSLINEFLQLSGLRCLDGCLTSWSSSTSVISHAHIRPTFRTHFHSPSDPNPLLYVTPPYHRSTPTTCKRPHVTCTAACKRI